MLQSQLFLSKKGSLGSVWVAAYCLKRLHRDQIVQTSIPSSVDKILTDGCATVTYRILAFLLLGVVRIYSKKVEFVLHDCQEILNGLNKFVGKKKVDSFRELVRAQDFSITLPERYELDAFVLEYDDDGNEAHIAKQDDIVIEGTFRNDKSANCSISKYPKNVTSQGKTTPFVSKTSSATIELNPCFSAQNPPESPTALAFIEHCMEFDLGASSSHLVRSFEESIEDFREIRFSREECLDFEIFYQNDKEHAGIFQSPIIIQSANAEHNDILDSAAEEETQTAEISCGSDMPSDNLDSRNSEENEVNFTVQTSSPDANVVSNNQEKVTSEDEGNLTDRSTDLEIASDDHNSVTAANTIIVEHLGRVSQPDTSAPVTSEKEEIPMKNQTTPDLKFPDGKGCTGLLAICTPANMEGVKKTEKRKCVFDDVTELSSLEIKDNIDDTRNLIRKRRIVPLSSLALWRQSCIYDLPQKFMEPLIPGNMATTGIAINLKEIEVMSNAIDRVEAVDAPAAPVMAVDVDRTETAEARANPVMAVELNRAEAVEVPANPVMATAVNRAEAVQVPANPVMAVGRVEIIQVPANPGMDGGLSIVAPGTPLQWLTSTRALVSPNAADSDGVGEGGPSLLFQTVSLEKGDCQSFENEGQDFSTDSDEEVALDLTDKQDADGTGDSQKQDGWSTRTRTIARRLHKVLASKTKSEEAKTVNLSGILDGKKRKESARVFYEILMLGSGDYVKVSQEGAYGDIHLQGTQKMERKLTESAV